MTRDGSDERFRHRPAALMSHHLVEGSTSEANLPPPRGDSNKTEPPLRKGD